MLLIFPFFNPFFQGQGRLWDSFSIRMRDASVKHRAGDRHPDNGSGVCEQRDYDIRQSRRVCLQGRDRRQRLDNTSFRYSWGWQEGHEIYPGLLKGNLCCNACGCLLEGAGGLSKEYQRPVQTGNSPPEGEDLHFIIFNIFLHLSRQSTPIR